MADAIRQGAKPVLIFPGGMPRALDYLRRCQREGVAVVGASSLAYDVASSQYPAWLRLPYIHQVDFDAALGKAIRDYGIGGIYSPNPVIWNHLHDYQRRRILTFLDPERDHFGDLEDDLFAHLAAAQVDIAANREGAG